MAADICTPKDVAIRSTEVYSRPRQETAACSDQPLFVLEAKLGPNNWQTVTAAYPSADISSYFSDRDTAKRAKSNLKSMLLGPWRGRFNKRPLRIRELAQAGESHIPEHQPT